MTTSTTAADTVEAPSHRRRDRRWWADLDATALDGRVTMVELGALLLAAVAGLVALLSLAAAHLHHYTAAVVAPVIVVVLAVIGAIVWWRDRPRVQLDLAGTGVALLGLGLAALMMFPGFPYATGDRDPGVYVETGASIQRTGSVSYRDDLLSPALPPRAKPKSVIYTWPGLWRNRRVTGEIFPQFYHLWPALLAAAKDAGGWQALFNLGPLCAVVAVLLAIAVARRLAGLAAALAVAVILPTNMLEVWQAKYPSSEIFGQLLFLGALAATVLALRSGWKTAAAAGGVFVGLVYLERPDGILIVLLAWGVLAALMALRRFDARAGWFTAGLLVVLPYGLWQAYHLAARYTSANAVPRFSTVVIAMVVLAAVGWALGRWRRFPHAVVAWAGSRRVQRNLGWLMVLLCAALEVVGLFRRQWFGIDRTLAPDGTLRRTFDEASLIRLSWFFTWPGLVLVVAGVGFVALRRWRLDRWLVAAPAVVLGALYCYHVRNSAYLMWSTRRFVPTVVPGLVLLIGFGIGFAVLIVRRFAPPWVAAVAVVAALGGFVAFNLSESWALRSHHEHQGSVSALNTIGGLSHGRDGVFLWDSPTYCCAAPAQLFGGPLLAVLGQSSAKTPHDQARAATMIRYDVGHFTAQGRPVFYVADQNGKPPDVAGVQGTAVLRLQGTLPHWEETFTSRPRQRNDYHYLLTVYRLQPSVAGQPAGP